MPELISISKLSYSYRRQCVLSELELDVPQGTTLGVIGPNGGGKTTLVKLLVGLIDPDQGQIHVAGMTPREARKRGDILGYLPQRPTIPERLPINVRQLVQIGLAGKTGMLKPYLKQDLDFVEHLIERMSLKDVASQPVGELSGGQQQRVLIARALAPKPKLLVLDEPTTGIDPAGQQQFIELLTALREELNLTIVFVSHDLRAVSAIADRVACLNVTVHYHDVPQHMPADLMYRMFACDADVMGLQKPMQIGLPMARVGSR